MKRPEYVAGVVRIYRKYVDRYLKYGEQGYQVLEEDRKELLLLFNRDGFSSGYYEQHNGRNMMALQNRKPTDQEKREYEALIAQLRKNYVDTERKLPIEGTLYAKAGEPLRFTLCLADGDPDVRKRTLCTVTGDCPELPKNLPMEEEKLKKQLQKLGNTPFVWEKLAIETDGPVFVPVQALNRLRRDAADALQKRIVESAFRAPGCEKKMAEPARIPKGTPSSAALHISVETAEQLSGVLAMAEQLKGHPAALTAVYVDESWTFSALVKAIERIHGCGLKAYVVLPPVFRLKTAERYEEQAEDWKHLGADGFVIKNLEEYEFLNQIGWERERILDHNVYTFNGESRDYWREAGVYMQTNPLELNQKELSGLSGPDSIQIIYGRYPMMVTAGCLHKTLGQCKKQPGLWTLRDRYQKEFPVKNNCRDCYNVIYNSQPLYLLDQMEAVSRLGAGAYRIMFTTENKEETERVLSGWLGAARSQVEFTRGHFKRGVE